MLGINIESDNTAKQAGFTLVEILAALVIILIMVMAFVPMYEVIAKTMHNNKTRQVATGLANSVIEEMRTLPYIVKDPDTGQIVTDPNVPQLGIKGGNPPGSIDAEQTREIDGITYTIHTRVNWMADGGNPTAYKKVRVSVEAPSIFTGNVTVTSDFYTLAAEEGEAQVFESGHIAVHIRDKDGNILMSPDIYVRIESDSLSESSYTDDGETLFGIIPASNYTVAVKLPSGMVTRPDQVLNSGYLEQNVTVTNWNTESVYFDIDYPGKIRLTLNDSKTNNPITGNGVCEITWSDGSGSFTLPAKSFDQNDFTDGVLSASIIGNLWPGGNYSLKLNNVLDSQTWHAYDKYDMSQTGTPPPKKANGSDWDGSFSSANSTLNLTLPLNSLLKTYLIASTEFVETQLVKDPDNPDDEGTLQVTKWKDQSGNGYDDAAPPGGDNPPAFIDNALNGQPVIRFSGEQQQKLRIDDKAVSADDFTIIAVVKPDQEHEIDAEIISGTGGVSGQKYLFWPEWGGTADAGQGISLGTNGISNYEHGDRYMPPTAVYAGSVNGFNVIGVNYDNKKPFIFLNGSVVREGRSSPRSHVFSPVIIGGQTYGYFTGDVAEILIYGCSLNQANMTTVTNYLKDKYNL